MINLISESSVGSTSRRVESLVGIEAFEDLAVERAIVTQLSGSLKTPREQLPQKISDLLASLKSAEKKIAAYEARAVLDRVPALLETAARTGSVRLVAQNVGALGSADDLRTLATTVRERLGSDASVVALAATAGDKPIVVVATNQAARDAGVKAGALAKTASGVLGGGGGGKDDLAQGGGVDAGAIPAAIAAISEAVGG